MQTLEILLMPFGFFALVSGAGAARAGLRAAAAEDAGRRFEEWGMCVALTLITVLCTVGAWMWSGLGF